MKKLFSILAILALVLSNITPAFAATYYWDTAGSMVWETGANWSDNSASGGTTGVVPGGADSAVFNQSAVNGNMAFQLGADHAVAGITIGNTGTTLIDSNLVGTTRNLSIGTGGITVNSGAGAGTIGWSNQPLNITLTGAQAWTNNSSNILTIVNDIANGANLLTVAGSGNTALNGVLGGGAGGLNKTGAGTLTLSGNNSYSGDTKVSAGTLVLGANLALQNSALDTSGAGVVNATGFTTPTLGGLKGSTNLSSVITTGYGTVTALTLNPGNGLTDTYSGVIANGAAGMTLTKSGLGTQVLSGPNTYTGATSVNAGTLVAGYLGNSTKGTFGNSSSIIVNNGGTISLAAGWNTLVGWGGYQAANSQTIQINSGGTILDTTGSSNHLTNLVMNGGTLQESGAGESNWGSWCFDHGVSTPGNGLTSSITGGNATLTELGGTQFNIGAGDILNVSTDLIAGWSTDNTGLIKTGTGTLSLSGTNTYTSATSINAGKLTITTATGLGTTAGGVSVANGAILDLNGTFAVGNEAVTLADGSALSSSAGTNSISGAIGLTGTSTVNVATSFTLSGAIHGQGTYPNDILDKTGAGTLILSGNADNTGLSVTVDAGTLSLEKTTLNAVGDLIVNAGTVRLNGTDDKQIWDSGKVTLNGGLLDMNAHNETIGSLAGTAGTVTNNATGTSTLTTGADNLSSTFSGTLQDGGSGKVLALSKTGSGVLSLSGTNSYSGGTALNAGLLSFANGSLGSSGVVEFKANSTLQWATGNVQDLSSRIKIDDGITATLDTQANNVTLANAFQTGTLGTGGFTKAGSGILGLSGANVYTGTTRINAGTVQVGNANAFGSGPVINNATVDLGTTNTTVGGVYTQNSGATLKLTANSATDYGKITTASTAVVNSGSSVYVNVGGFIANNAILKIIDTGSTGITLAGAGTSPAVDSSNSKVSFLASILNNDLILTASRAATGYTPIATTTDSKAAATVLDNITNPSSDMTTVLSTLDGLTNAQTAAALNTMVPDISGFNPQVPVTLMEQFVGTQMDHLGGVSPLALGNAVPQTGMSAGDQPSTLSTWYKAFGNYAHQDPRGTSLGYNFSNAGGALGFERQLSDAFKTGIALGNSQSWVRGKDSTSRTDINATQASLYGGFKPVSSPWYLNGSLNYTYGEYGGSREIHISSSDNRIANSDYRGDLYGATLESGYGIKVGKTVLTPLASLAYSHLHVGKYSEADAGALNLNVDTQDYDNLRAGLGGKLESEKKLSFGTLMSDIHAKYLYDVIADRQNMVASFAGGGTAFTTQGYKPVRSGANIGTGITIATNKNVTLSLQYDYEMRQGYYAHTGSLNVAYKF